MAFLTSPISIFEIGPSTLSLSHMPSQSFSSFKSFSIYSFQTSIKFSSPTTISPLLFFMQLTDVTSSFLLTICRAALKILFLLVLSLMLSTKSFRCVLIAAETIFLALRLATLYSLRNMLSLMVPTLFFHSLCATFFSSTTFEMSSFHHHVTLCIGGPHVLPHNSSAVVTILSLNSFHIVLQSLAVAGTLRATSRSSLNVLAISGFFSFHILIFFDHFLLRFFFNFTTTSATTK